MPTLDIIKNYDLYRIKDYEDITIVSKCVFFDDRNNILLTFVFYKNS